MDRFIVPKGGEFSEQKANLKSNMDRFIGLSIFGSYCRLHNLKSNMDRFIDRNKSC